MPTLKSKCTSCKTPFEYVSTRSSGTYCSNSCQQTYQTKLLFDKIKLFGGKPKGVSAPTMKAYLLKTRGHKCKLCKGTEWRGKPIPLVMDHRDGNSEHWALENLRLICCNCDAQTDTYKNRNIGKGRHSRRKRYEEGKSY